MQVVRLGGSAARKFVDKLRFERGHLPRHREPETSVVDHRMSEGGEARMSATAPATRDHRREGHHRPQARRPESRLRRKGNGRFVQFAELKAGDAIGDLRRMFSFTPAEVSRYLEQWRDRAQVAIANYDINALIFALGICGLILVLAWLFA
jgi:hypothetical protein